MMTHGKIKYGLAIVEVVITSQECRKTIEDIKL